MVPSPSVDALLMYGYAQKGVEHIELKIDMESDIEKPSVLYNVKLEPSARLKWKAVQSALQIKSSLLQKAALLALKKAGAPINIEKTIVGLAKAYLPEKFQCEVKIVE